MDSNPLLENAFTISLHSTLLTFTFLLVQGTVIEVLFIPISVVGLLNISAAVLDSFETISYYIGIHNALVRVYEKYDILTKFVIHSTITLNYYMYSFVGVPRWVLYDREPLAVVGDETVEEVHRVCEDVYSVRVDGSGVTFRPIGNVIQYVRDSETIEMRDDFESEWVASTI